MGSSVVWGWNVWLLLGVCAGLGYGLTQRLLDLQPGESGLGGHQTFAVKAFPGTSLDGLRRGQRAGAGASRGLRVDLDAVAAERRRKEEAKELEQRQAAMERRQREEQSRRDAEQDRLRLEELNRTPEPPADPGLQVSPGDLSDPTLDQPTVPPPGEDATLQP